MKRPYLSPEQWVPIINRQQASGLSQTAFCRQQGIPESSFGNARHRLLSYGLLGRASRSKDFVEATVTPAPVRDSSSPLEVRLRGKRRLRVQAGFDHATLADVVRILEGLA